MIQYSIIRPAGYKVKCSEVFQCFIHWSEGERGNAAYGQHMSIAMGLKRRYIMNTPVEVKVTDEGLLIPHEAYESFGEVEIVRTPEAIVIQPKYKSREQIVKMLQNRGLLLRSQQAMPPEKPISQEERAILAHKFSVGRPLSEIIIEEREDRW